MFVCLFVCLFLPGILQLLWCCCFVWCLFAQDFSRYFATSLLFVCCLFPRYFTLYTEWLGCSGSGRSCWDVPIVAERQTGSIHNVPSGSFSNNRKLPSLCALLPVWKGKKREKEEEANKQASRIDLDLRGTVEKIVQSMFVATVREKLNNVFLMQCFKFSVALRPQKPY